MWKQIIANIGYWWRSAGSAFVAVWCGYSHRLLQLTFHCYLCDYHLCFWWRHGSHFYLCSFCSTQSLISDIFISNDVNLNSMRQCRGKSNLFFEQNKENKAERYFDNKMYSMAFLFILKRNRKDKERKRKCRIKGANDIRVSLNVKIASNWANAKCRIFINIEYFFFFAHAILSLLVSFIGALGASECLCA